MPWYANEFSNNDVKDELDERFKVEGIPTLIMINAKTGETINTETVGSVRVDDEGLDFPWAPKSCEILTPATAGTIGPSPAFFIFCGTDAKAKALQEDIAGAVDVWRGKQEEGAVCHGEVCLPTGGKLEGTEDLLFFVCGDNSVVTRVKELANAQSGVVVAALDLSVPVYAHADIPSVDKVTPLALRKFVQAFLEGKVAKTAVSRA